MYIANMTLGCTHEKALLVSVDDLESISILLEHEEQILNRSKNVILLLQKSI